MSKKVTLRDALNNPSLRKKFVAAMAATFGEDVVLPPAGNAIVVIQPDGFRTFNIPDECAERVRGIAGYLRKHTDLRAVEKAQVDDGLRLALMIGLDQLEAEAKYQAERDAGLSDDDVVTLTEVVAAAVGVG